MKKLIALLALGTGFSASAQTLFYYGKDSVTTAEFLRAFEKNNNGPRTEKAIRDYLDLYTGSRLKVAEAKAMGFDTLPQMVADLSSLRQQILPGYLTDKETMSRLVNEAFQRSQKDIRLSHIFISTKNSTPEEVAAARQRADEALKALKAGQAFSEVAARFSDDPAAKTNGGALGWITAFSLPYELENLAYGTATGKVSESHRSRAGFHIFKNEGERKALGRMKAAQILLAFPPDADETYKAQLKKTADSLYQRILKGADFGKLAAQFSNDQYSASANGQMMEFGVGQYDVQFEAKAFGLGKDGAVTPPFQSPYGFHIVKRMGHVPVAASQTEEVAAHLKEKVESSDRMRASRSALMKKVAQQAGMKKVWSDDAALWLYSDSVLNGQQAPKNNPVKPQTAVLSFNKKDINAADWIGYAQTFRYKTDGSGMKNYLQLWDEFVEAQAMDYYQNHLEDFNEEFRVQLNEFRDGNLFFEIMQREVWGPAQTDSAGLQQYYAGNKTKYQWSESADAVLFYASDSAMVRSFLAQLKKDPSKWRALVADLSEKIAADSGRFELNQLPNLPKGAKAGSLTGLQNNPADGSVSFAYVIRLYPAGQQRSFADARGLVINDYQQELEKKWLEKLRQKYPVRVNETELSKLK